MNEVRDLAGFLDRVGFHSMWFAEHHFSIWGRELLPNPIIMATDIAARTTRLRIGLGAAIVTFWHPLRLAEDIALLDQLSNGRLEVGVGRGNYGLEGSNLNPMADPRNPEENFAIFEETVAILKKAFSERVFSHHGRKYQVPAPGFKWDRAHPVNDAAYVDKSGELVHLSIYPQPRQRPYPPFWQMVDSPSSVEWAGKNDIGIIMWRPPVTMLKERFKLFRDAARSAGRELRFGEGTGVLRDAFVAESRSEARELAEHYLMMNLNWSNWRGPKIYLAPGEVLTEQQEAALKKQLTFEFVNDRSLLFGTAEEVADKIQELHDETQMEQLLISSSWSGLPHDRTMRSMRLFVDKVIPRLNLEKAIPAHAAE
jgi:alkanesulfonate monooxygenase SsuD/methylene tetrahydromethanopterin reductase-like flavin-dependent oxidoreductase (luciferase family)